MATISLDWDGTATADKGLFAEFVTSAKRRGHDVVICTMRHPHESEEVQEYADMLGILVIYTRRKAKAAYCQDHGIKIDIWIDDSPHWIYGDSF